MSEIVDWYAIDRVLDSPENDWRQLAIIGGVTPQWLENVIPALNDEQSRLEAREHLAFYMSEIEMFIGNFEDIPPKTLRDITEKVVFEVWNLRVQSKAELRVTVDGLVRKHNSEELEPA